MQKMIEKKTGMPARKSEQRGGRAPVKGARVSNQRNAARTSQQRGVNPDDFEQNPLNILRRSFNRFSANRGGIESVRRPEQPQASAPTGPQPTALGPSPQGLGSDRRGSKASVNSSDRAMSTVSLGSREHILKKGYINKKGVINTAWKKRYFILTNRTLYYYDEANGAALEDAPEFSMISVSPKGAIDLAMVVDIERHDKEKEKFSVKTAVRRYKLRAENAKQAEAWTGGIIGAVEHSKKMLHRDQNLRDRRESISSLKADELDTGFSDGLSIGRSSSFGTTSDAPHTPAAVDMYVNWGKFDVAAWLYTIDMGHKYSEHFYQNNVDGKVLEKCVKDKDTLTDIGVEQGDANAILTGIKKLEAEFKRS